MRSTTITWQRSGATLQSGIAVQVENMSFMVATNLGGQSPYDSFWIYTTGGYVPDVQRNDLLIDENQIDAKTGNKTQYRVFGNPEGYDFSHIEIPAEKIRGK